MAAVESTSVIESVYAGHVNKHILRTRSYLVGYRMENELLCVRGVVPVLPRIWG